MLPALEAGDFVELTPLYLKAQHMRTMPTINMRNGVLFASLMHSRVKLISISNIIYIYIYVIIFKRILVGDCGLDMLYG